MKEPSPKTVIILIFATFKNLKFYWEKGTAVIIDNCPCLYSLYAIREKKNVLITETFLSFWEIKFYITSKSLK